MPNDPEQVVWVWFDALINYLSVLLQEEVEARADQPDPLPWDELIQSPRFQQFWPQAVHLIGKDILWHHTLIWWAMLIGAGIAPPKLVFAHGWWTLEGLKISKSLGTNLDPSVVVRRLGNDPLRYYLLREMTFGADGDFSIGGLVGRINTDLGKGGLGNLVSRTLNLVEKHRGAHVPSFDTGALQPAEGGLVDQTVEQIEAYQRYIESYQFHLALESIWKIVRQASQYIDDQAPWRLAKDEEKDPAAGKRLDAVLYHLCEVCRVLAEGLEPVIPETARALRQKLGQPLEPTTPLRDRVQWGRLEPGTPVEKGEHLFPPIDAALTITASFDESAADGPTVTVHLDGFLEGSTAETLDAALKNVRAGKHPLQPHQKPGQEASVGFKPSRLLLDVSNLAYCSQAGLKPLDKARKKLDALSVSGVHEAVRDVLSRYAS